MTTLLLKGACLRRAADQDLPELRELLRAAANDMHARGYTAWPRTGFPVERIAPTVADGSVWLLTEHGRTGRLVGTITLDEHADPEFAAAGLTGDGVALFVHRMARDPRDRGRGIGRLLLDFASDHAATLGLPEVWLNVNRAGIPLQRWYARQGYTHMGTVISTGRQSGWLARTPAAPVPDLHQQVEIIA